GEGRGVRLRGAWGPVVRGPIPPEVEVQRVDGGGVVRLDGDLEPLRAGVVALEPPAHVAGLLLEVLVVEEAQRIAGDDGLDRPAGRVAPHRLVLELEDALRVPARV